MKISFELCEQIFLTFIILIIMIVVFLLILSQFNTQIWDYYKDTCDKMDGTLWFYECQEPPIFSTGTPCKDLKTGAYCIILNGTEVDINIRNMIA